MIQAYLLKIEFFCPDYKQEVFFLLIVVLEHEHWRLYDQMEDKNFMHYKGRSAAASEVC